MKKTLSEKETNKMVLEKISEYLEIRFWDTPFIRDCTLLDFQIRIWRQIPYNPEDNIEHKRELTLKKVKRHRAVKKYLSLNK